MFKVVALLAIVGYVSAGVSVRDQIALNNQIATQNAINLNGALRNGVLGGQIVSPFGYSAVGVPALGVTSVGQVASLRDAAALQNQINTQNAINSQGSVSVRDAVALNNQIATQNLINSRVAVPTAVLTRGAVVATGEDVNAINDRIYTQIAVEQGIAARNAGVLSQGNVVGVTPYLSSFGVSARDAAALNNQIATQNAINSGLILG
jgi:hypothetical protein